MRNLLLALLVSLAGCAFPGSTQPQSPAFVNGAMAAVAVVSYVKEFGCVPQGAVPTVGVACTPISSTDPNVQSQAFLGCLLAGIMTSGGGLIKQCPATSTPAISPVIPATPAPPPK